MSIIETCNGHLKTFSHNSYHFFNTHNIKSTTHWQTPELHHQQIPYVAADNIYRCFVNLPWSFVLRCKITSEHFLGSWVTFILKRNLKKYHARVLLQLLCKNWVTFRKTSSKYWKQTLSFCAYCFMLFENIDKSQKYAVNLMKNNWEVMIALMVILLLQG